jgi:glycine/D-amino acid oxidase-like deaminating enzyme
MPRCYFALGFGGNGITFSIIAAEIVRDILLRRPNPHARLFRFDR